MSELIKVSKDVKKKLLKIAGELQSERGKKYLSARQLAFLSPVMRERTVARRRALWNRSHT
ncbi:hypothetical protein B9Q13_04215 [Candidatus Marsarchaeota G2 archaeon ECH_B_SAG-G16]|jgi:hypothetical protein|uniref:Uncharacterized protein n=4 Tax=Candidatus Marsarchaeota TaxID=1978152 RepID=A0A2R6A6F4_9ARCH|nr:MAG: hypothetical protein B9Q01_09640 [Candidatus Marsarchaeota G1 archaeon OSP_D]PSN88827.1 MAG: hypothetical protein B9Q00_04005 [Candidatus Marsarchaeota G1 archaeon OSP_C]PSN91876.1 MAG: hypothetical protein B9P99_03770 [Candidatus Marsarchaeota G1 archaeon OSP_B]PSO04584.1 MAG: hypothetical protein B9Q13_04215 [Candidatus Marsarchaeota G2 archaeon ECH_B_SAG-G16]